MPMGVGLFSLSAHHFLGVKHLCISENIKTSSKKYIIKTISVLIRQPPLKFYGTHVACARVWIFSNTSPLCNAPFFVGDS